MGGKGLVFGGHRHVPTSPDSAITSQVSEPGPPDDDAKLLAYLQNHEAERLLRVGKAASDNDTKALTIATAELLVSVASGVPGLGLAGATAAKAVLEQRSTKLADLSIAAAYARDVREERVVGLAQWCRDLIVSAQATLQDDVRDTKGIAIEIGDTQVEQIALSAERHAALMQQIEELNRQITTLGAQNHPLPAPAGPATYGALIEDLGLWDDAASAGQDLYELQLMLEQPALRQGGGLLAGSGGLFGIERVKRSGRVGCPTMV